MSDTGYKFDERLAYASTLPSDWYTDPEMLGREKLKIFSRTWQLVGHSEQVQSVGDYFTAVIADEPIIVARGRDERLRAFSNVCRHRAGPVAAGSGNRKAFQCGYHGWSYGLDGRLLGTPEFDGVACFDKDEMCLPEFRVETWAGLVFVNLDPNCMPLAAMLEDLTGRIGHSDLGSFRPAARKEWHVDCNWKVYVDNYLEGYHIPIVHPSLNRELDYQQYRTETRQYYSIQHSPIKSAEGARLRRYDGGAGSEAQYFWIFPNLMVNVYPDNYSTNLIIPIDSSRTLTVFEWYLRTASEPRMNEVVAFSDEVQLEDIAICEAVQRGLRSPNYKTGRYSVRRENGVHHFHKLIVESLAR